MGHTLVMRLAKLSKHMGDTDIRTGDIRISDALSLDQKQATALHEIMHNIWSFGGLNQAICQLKNPTSSQIEELVVRAFENGVFSLIKDNPSFMKWISK